MHHSRRLALYHFWVAFATFLPAILLGAWQMLSRSPMVPPIENPGNYYESVTLHGTAMAYVVTTFFAMGFGYAVTATLAAVFIEGIYCDGVAAVIGPVKGFPGSVYQLTIIAPTPQVNPNFSGYGVILQIGAGASQNGLAVSISQ